MKYRHRVACLVVCLFALLAPSAHIAGQPAPIKIGLTAAVSGGSEIGRAHV